MDVGSKRVQNFNVANLVVECPPNHFLRIPRMSLLQALSYGTERYPPRVARRLCALNFGCWAVASMAMAFAIVYLPEVKLRTVVIIDVVMAAGVHKPRQLPFSWSAIQEASSSAFSSVRTAGCRCNSWHMPLAQSWF
jgi:hypothetical protein